MRLWVSAFVLAICLPQSTWAQGAARDLFPLGAEESFMANTGLALRGSAGSAHFNPALLTTLSRPRFSISSNNFSFFKSNVTDREPLDGQELSLDINSFEPIPSSMIQTFNYFGDAQALFILVPRALSTDQKSNLNTDNFDITLLNVARSQELRIGGSYAFRFDELIEGLSLGASLYGIYLSFSSTAALTSVADPSSSTASFAASREEAKFYGLGGSLGLALSPNETWTFGFKWESPVLEIHGVSDSFSQIVSVDGGVLSDQKEIGPKNINYDRPMAFGLGAAWSPTSRFRIETDLYFLTPLSYSINASEGRFRSGFGYEVRAGVQGRVFERFQTSAGFQFNPSATKKDSSEDPIDYWGFSGGLDYLGEQYTFGLGGYWISGSGESDALGGGAGGASLTAKHYGVLLTATRAF